CPPGPLAEGMSLEDSEPNGRAGFSKGQLDSIERDRRSQIIEREVERMRQHVLSCRTPGTGIACAILEMPDGLKDRQADPYLASKRALARANCLPQIVLNPPASGRRKKDDFPEKLRAAVGDLLRMLGVSPLVPVDFTLASIGRIKRGGAEILE